MAGRYPEDFHSREGDAALGNFDSDHPWELIARRWRGPGDGKRMAPSNPARLHPASRQGRRRDGNFILNVGPRPDGLIDPPQAQRLKETAIGWQIR